MSCEKTADVKSHTSRWWKIHLKVLEHLCKRRNNKDGQEQDRKERYTEHKRRVRQPCMAEVANSNLKVGVGCRVVRQCYIQTVLACVGILRIILRNHTSDVAKHQ